MAITPGTDVDEKPEPLPRGPVVEQGGQLSRGWFNWFNGKDRMLGEIVSGVNRNRQNIVQLQTDYQAADGSLSSAYIAADAVVAADATSARAALSTTLTAAFQAADATLQTQIDNRATITQLNTVESDAASARATIATNLTAETTNRTNADTALQGQITTNATAITNRATITQLNTVETTLTGSIATLSSNLSAETTARTNADTALQTDINTRATNTRVDTVESDAASALASSVSSLTAAYQAADATLQSDINTRATSAALTSESTARASADSALASSITSLTATVGGNTSSITTNATAISTLNSSSAIYEVIAAASGGNPARIKLKAGVGGADVELDADRVWFGDETRFDTTSETFITEVGGVRSRYGTAFGASGNEVVMWHGPTSVAVGSEARNNGYLAIGTNGSIWHNTAALDWGATAAEAAASNAQVPVGTNACVDSAFERDLYAWQAGWAGNQGQPHAVTKNTYGAAARNYYVANATGTPAAGTVFDVLATKGTYLSTDLANTKLFAMPVAPGQRVYAAAQFTGEHISAVATQVLWLDKDGVTLSAASAGSALPSAQGLPTITSWDRIGGFLTAPANTAFAAIFFRATCDGTANPYCAMTSPMLARVPANQTEPPPYMPGRPDPVGDQTGANTAAAITGQGWGATAAEAAASNAQVAYGANALTNTEFNYSTAHPPVGWDNGWNGTAATTIQRDYSPALDNVKVARAVALGTPAAGTVFDNINSGSASRLPVRPGDLVCGSAFVECLGSSPVAQTSIAVIFRTQNGTYISEAHSPTISNANFPLDSVAKFQRATVFATAPAAAAYADLFQRAYCNGGSFPAVYMLRPMLALVRAGTTAAPQYTPGVAYRQADPTNANTAAAITGQGVWATGNYYEQTSDPGSVPNGSFWFKTDTNEFYVRRSGAWGKVATIANQNIAISRTNGFVKTRIGAGTITSDSVSFSSTGGSGTGYTYAHELFTTYTTGPSPSISSASGSPITASASGAVPGDEVRGFVQTTVTDSVGNKTTLTSPVALFCES